MELLPDLDYYTLQSPSIDDEEVIHIEHEKEVKTNCNRGESEINLILDDLTIIVCGQDCK